MDDELECTWKEAAVAYFMSLSRDSRVWNKKNSRNSSGRLGGVPGAIRIGHPT